MPTISLDIECPSCSGTGLYRGFAEGKGVAVVCRTCNGTGCQKFTKTYKPFSGGRIHVTGIKRVFECNVGICLGVASQGGLTYEEWLAGKEFTEQRNTVCPAWYYQTADYNKKPNWKECSGCGSFPSCKNFATKHKCWERFDKEHSGG